jgi:acetyltransferase-like isoleucine patch superfamily enzyme
MLRYKIFFLLRVKWKNRFGTIARRIYYQIQGMEIGEKTNMPNIQVTWPHQVKIGKGCILEKDIVFNFDSTCKKGPHIIIGDETFVGRGVECNIQSGLSIGNQVLIGSGVKFIDHNHGTAIFPEIKNQTSDKKEISIGNDVWLGSNAIVLKGSIIEDGAIIAAGSIVNSRVPSKEIWGGVPAKKISTRK